MASKVICAILVVAIAAGCSAHIEWFLHGRNNKNSGGSGGGSAGGSAGGSGGANFGVSFGGSGGGSNGASFGASAGGNLGGIGGGSGFQVQLGGIGSGKLAGKTGILNHIFEKDKTPVYRQPVLQVEWSCFDDFGGQVVQLRESGLCTDRVNCRPEAFNLNKINFPVYNTVS